MDDMTISNTTFPDVIKPEYQVGDTVTLTVAARITGIHEEQIDITGFSVKRQYVPGERTTTLTILEISPPPHNHQRQ